MFGQTKPGGAQAPSGIAMMLKAIGFDPAEFQKMIATLQTQAAAVVTRFDQRLQVIESQQKEIIARLDRIEAAYRAEIPAPAPEVAAGQVQEIDTWPTMPPK